MDEATQKLVESQTKHIVLQVAEQVEKSRGTIPGEFEELIKKLQEVEPPKFDWKGYMRRFAGKSVKTYTKKSRRKYNKRLPDFPGLKIKRQKHILAAVDTSGSVSTKELKEFLNELYHLKKTGSDVTVIQCDTAISHIGPFDPKADWEIHGRGGTDFQPVIDYYNENMDKYSCLFYFTDGGAPSPDNARGNLLWVLSSAGSEYEKLPGHVIKLEI
jgi:predicted metal-dependent peptidase